MSRTTTGRRREMSSPARSLPGRAPCGAAGSVSWAAPVSSNNVSGRRHYGMSRTMDESTSGPPRPSCTPRNRRSKKTTRIAWLYFSLGLWGLVAKTPALYTSSTASAASGLYVALGIVLCLLGASHLRGDDPIVRDWLWAEYSLLLIAMLTVPSSPLFVGAAWPTWKESFSNDPVGAIVWGLWALGMLVLVVSAGIGRLRRRPQVGVQVE